MIRNTMQFEVEIQGKKAIFTLDNDTPIMIAKEMIFQLIKHVGKIEDQAIFDAQNKSESGKEECKECTEVVDDIPTAG